jgi:hypothetical protein
MTLNPGQPTKSGNSRQCRLHFKKAIDRHPNLLRQSELEQCIIVKIAGDMKRTGICIHALLIAAACFLSTVVFAQPLPTRTVRIIVPFPPGQAADSIARVSQHGPASR